MLQCMAVKSSFLNWTRRIITLMETLPRVYLGHVCHRSRQAMNTKRVKIGGGCSKRTRDMKASVRLDVVTLSCDLHLLL
jgi:hypothetical protein